MVPSMHFLGDIMMSHDGIGANALYRLEAAPEYLRRYKYYRGAGDDFTMLA